MLHSICGYIKFKRFNHKEKKILIRMKGKLKPLFLINEYLDVLYKQSTLLFTLKK